MSGRIRNPNTRISKPAISRECSILKPETLHNETSDQGLQGAYPSSPDNVFSNETMAKLHAFRYHEPVQSAPADLCETGPAVDAMDYSCIDPGLKPKEEDPQISDHSDDEAGYLYGHIEDDSSQMLNACNDQNVDTDPCERPTSQHGKEMARGSRCLPQANPSNNDGDNCSCYVMANTSNVHDTDEFDEQVDDTTLMSIPDSSNLSSSDSPSSSAWSGTGKCPQDSLQEIHGDAFVQFLTAAADKSEDESSANCNDFRGNYGVTYNGGTRTGVCRSPSVPATQCEDICPSSATMSVTTSSDSHPPPSHQTQAPGREGLTCGAPCSQQNIGLSRRNTSAQFQPVDSKDIGNVTRLDGLQSTIPPGVSAAANNSARQVRRPKQNPPTPPSRHTGTQQSLNPRPFLRSPFPESVPDRSPIQGLSSPTLVRTCFRIGEALNASLSPRKPSSAPSTTLIELYAFVEHSYRSNQTQFFRFVDLFFPSRPPFLTGIWQGWSGNSVFDEDGRAFLGRGGREWKWNNSVMAGQKGKSTGEQHQGSSSTGGGFPGAEFGGGRKLCRVVGIIERFSRPDGRDMYDGAGYISPSTSAVEGVVMTVWSTWEVGWPDVEYVKGIIEA